MPKYTTQCRVASARTTTARCGIERTNHERNRDNMMSFILFREQKGMASYYSYCSPAFFRFCNQSTFPFVLPRSSVFLDSSTGEVQYNVIQETKTMASLTTSIAHQPVSGLAIFCFSLLSTFWQLALISVFVYFRFSENVSSVCLNTRAPDSLYDRSN